MIRVRLAFDEGGHLVAIRSEGHARRSPILELFSTARQRYHAVCAAISILESTLAVTLDRMGLAGLKPQVSRGAFSLELPPGPKGDAMDAVLSFFVTGVKLLAHDHPEQIQISIQTQSSR